MKRNAKFFSSRYHENRDSALFALSRSDWNSYIGDKYELRLIIKRGTRKIYVKRK